MRALGQAVASNDSDYTDLLASVFEFMLMSGSSRDLILQVAKKALAKAERAQAHEPASRHGGLATAGLILDSWHRNRRYIDSGAIPRAIPLLGAAPSVEALIRAERPRADAVATARHLKSLRLVVGTGKGLYRPADCIALISQMNPLVEQHVARSASNLLKTIKQNISQRRKGRRLIERFAEVPDLPANCMGDFQEFTLTQGWAFLKNVNDWLESRRARRSVGRATRTRKAGVHIYAYVTPLSTKDKRRY